ncbi:MAG TPA: hypothetical protein PKD37_04325 [Oligoflexia bacterium]|nr:hypothetical protein [Oligoflexia bacterium]HMP27193.1 hypothetical protein [Oligoflexia bacterium]
MNRPNNSLATKVKVLRGLKNKSQKTYFNDTKNYQELPISSSCLVSKNYFNSAKERAKKPILTISTWDGRKVMTVG